MQAFVDFICVDGYNLSFSNLISFFGFCLIMGTMVMMCQAAFNAAGNIRR